MKWEKVDKAFGMFRTNVPGGWIVLLYGYRSGGLCFIPDKGHLWRPEVTKILGDDGEICRVCSTTKIEKTDVGKAMCSFQHIIDRTLICPKCDLTKRAREALRNPVTDCESCKYKTKSCFRGWGEGLEEDDGSSMATETWGGAGPDCITGRLEAAGRSVIKIFGGERCLLIQLHFLEVLMRSRLCLMKSSNSWNCETVSIRLKTK